MAAVLMTKGCVLDDDSPVIKRPISGTSASAALISVGSMRPLAQVILIPVPASPVTSPVVGSYCLKYCDTVAVMFEPFIPSEFNKVYGSELRAVMRGDAAIKPALRG